MILGWQLDYGKSSRGAKRRGDLKREREIATSSSCAALRRTPRDDQHSALSVEHLLIYISLYLVFQLPCHAYDPNTIIIKHQSGKNSKAILDKKFVHISAPVQNIINPNTQTDTSGLKNLALTKAISKSIIIPKNIPATTTSKNKSNPTTVNDKSSWDDYAELGSGEDLENSEELSVKAELI